ncbi:hypothetical protein KEM54_003411 [Ascosphaera aggregata]|nr:hypothetical protein KEM54_003411 [Ascosphaera aggregata]
MTLQLSRTIARSLKTGKPRLNCLPMVLAVDSSSPLPIRRRFHSSPLSRATKSQILKDVGEGISEVQIIQWYVEEGARIEEWSPLCQYQSDKAVDDITSRYEGVIKRLHVQADDTIETGKPLCDIEVDDGQYPDDVPKAREVAKVKTEAPTQTPKSPITENSGAANEPAESQQSPHQTLATPAVRALLKASGVNITDIQGTGKDGRVLKEDVQRYIALQGASTSSITVGDMSNEKSVAVKADTPMIETRKPLTPIQRQMFQKMSESRATVPFLYSDEMDSRSINGMRRALLTNRTNPIKLSILPFIVKAVSIALTSYPILNARVDTSTDPAKPTVVYRDNHNIGIAVDTPSGLIVPNIKNVQARSIFEIADEINRLGELARESKLSPKDIASGTFTISNIGAIGGLCVAPVIVPTEVAILGIGRTRVAPVFDEAGNILKGELTSMSWCADHRIIDGATVARTAALVRELLEQPERLLATMR